METRETQIKHYTITNYGESDNVQFLDVTEEGNSQLADTPDVKYKKLTKPAIRLIYHNGRLLRKYISLRKQISKIISPVKIA